MSKNLPFVALSIILSTTLIACSGTDNSPEDGRDMKDSRSSKDANSKYGHDIEESEVYVDGKLMKLVGGAHSNDWTIEISAADSIKLVKQVQADYQADPSKPTAIHVTIDGTSTEFLFEDPAVDLAGPWEKFATESGKLKDLPDTVHHFAGKESWLENEISSHAEKVPTQDCVKNIHEQASAVGTINKSIDEVYSVFVGVASCGEQQSEVSFDISPSQAEFAKDMATKYEEIDGPAKFAEIHYDGKTGETTLTPHEGNELDSAAFEKLKEVIEKYPNLAH